MKKKKIIYIAHPISGDIEGNLMDIRRIVKMLNINDPDVVPFVPYYADCVSMDDNIPTQRERGIENDNAILRSGIVDEMWLYGSKISSGMKAEIILAHELKIPVRCGSPNLVQDYDKFKEGRPDIPDEQGSIIIPKKLITNTGEPMTNENFYKKLGLTLARRERVMDGFMNTIFNSESNGGAIVTWTPKMYADDEKVRSALIASVEPIVKENVDQLKRKIHLNIKTNWTVGDQIRNQNFTHTEVLDVDDSCIIVAAHKSQVEFKIGDTMYLRG